MGLLTGLLTGLGLTEKNIIAAYLNTIIKNITKSL